MAQSVDGSDLAALTQAIKEAVTHPGFAFLNIIQACPSFKRW
ncbi:MAG: hypothetical protein U9Q15_05210 [Patescibacteria group bacterium]|nr:hypothetical protein [Patescibacteria group bacterium]